MTRLAASYATVAILLLGLATARLFGGSPPLDLIAIVDGIGMERDILLHFRMPRLLLAIATGAALGMCGSVLQVMLRNPLASPDIIGFGAGAATGAAAAILYFQNVSAAIPGALVGGTLTAVLIMTLAWRDGISPLSLVLVGVSLSLILTTATDILLSLSPGVLASETARFLTGSFASAEWRTVGLICLATAVGGGVFAFYAFAIDRIELGDDLAIALGLNPDHVRFFTTVCVALVVATAVAVAGPVPFVAFLAGPIARLAAGHPGTLLLLSGLIGALLAVAADTLAGIAIFDTRLPAGVFTALIGAPAMLALLLRMEGGRK